MIGIFDDSGNRLGIVYRGYTINQYQGTEEQKPYGVEVNSVAISTVTSAIEEPKNDADGMFFYTPRKTSKLIRLQGRIVAPDYGKLYDQIKTFGSKFDPSAAAFLNFDQGQNWMDFQTPSSSGTVLSSYFCVPQRTPSILIAQYGEFSSPYTLDMIAADPARYETSPVTLTFNGLGTQAAPNGDYQTFPEIAFTFNGVAGTNIRVTEQWYAANLGIQDPYIEVLTTPAFANGDVLRFVPKNKRWLLNGLNNPTANSKLAHGAWNFLIPPVTSNIVVSGSFTGLSSVVVTYRKAYSQ